MYDDDSRLSRNCDIEKKMSYKYVYNKDWHTEKSNLTQVISKIKTTIMLKLLNNVNRVAIYSIIITF